MADHKTGMMRGNDIYMISFSGGRSSAYMTERLLRELPSDRVVVCFANTGKEEEPTLEFVQRCNDRWGGVVHWLEYHATEPFRKVDFTSASRYGEPFQAMIEKRGYLPNVVWRFCTQDLKIRVIKRFMLSLGYQHWTNVIGIRYDEPARWAKVRAIGEKERWDTWLPMVNWRTTKAEVLAFWRSMPFDLALMPHEGNCDLCFLKGRAKIRRILTEHPEKAQWWIDQEKTTGGVFRKGFPLGPFLDLIQRSPTLFDYEELDIPCICNND
jgi:3'-phosphoadenosine 5'-phosphosulfate sulfotransferase (PAPS reductase)/FAD synthetase